jgi:hypothetical protein
MLHAVRENAPQLSGLSSVRWASHRHFTIPLHVVLAQGIKFYDPQIVGNTPESVELGGMRNLLAALGPKLGLTQGYPLLQVWVSFKLKLTLKLSMFCVD